MLNLFLLVILFNFVFLVCLGITQHILLQLFLTSEHLDPLLFDFFYLISSLFLHLPQTLLVLLNEVNFRLFLLFRKNFLIVGIEHFAQRVLIAIRWAHIATIIIIADLLMDNYYGSLTRILGDTCRAAIALH